MLFVSSSCQHPSIHPRKHVIQCVLCVPEAGWLIFYSRGFKNIEIHVGRAALYAKSPKADVGVISSEKDAERDLLLWECLFQWEGSCQQSELVEGQRPWSPSAGWDAWPGQTAPWSAYRSAWCLLEPCKGPIQTNPGRQAHGWLEDLADWLTDLN